MDDRRATASRTHACAVVCALALSIAACGDGPAPVETSGRTPTSPAAHAPSPASDVPSPPADASPPSADASPPPAADGRADAGDALPPPPDGDATPPVPGMDLPTRTSGRSSADATHTLPDVPILRAVRTGAQDGADRLVFEFDGDGLPAWSIEYVDRPVHECGSGDTVALPGDAWLQIRFMGAQAHTEAGEGTTGPKRRDVAMPNLLALARTCDFEGEVTWVAAVRRPDGYTPRVLDAPARLVVDIAH